MVSSRVGRESRASRNPPSAGVGRGAFSGSSKTGGFETPQKCTAKRSEIDSQTLTVPPTHLSLFSNAGGVQKAAPGEAKKVFGLNLPENESLSFLILAGGSLGSALGFAALQEGVFRIPGFKFGAWMTVLTTFTYFLCGALEMKLTGDSRKAFLEELRYPFRVHLRWYGVDQLRVVVPQLRHPHRVQVREDHPRHGLLRA